MQSKSYTYVDAFLKMYVISSHTACLSEAAVRRYVKGCGGVFCSVDLSSSWRLMLDFGDCWRFLFTESSF